MYKLQEFDEEWRPLKVYDETSKCWKTSSTRVAYEIMTRADSARLLSSFPKFMDTMPVAETLKNAVLECSKKFPGRFEIIQLHWSVNQEPMI